MVVLKVPVFIDIYTYAGLLHKTTMYIYIYITYIPLYY